MEKNKKFFGGTLFLIILLIIALMVLFFGIYKITKVEEEITSFTLYYNENLQNTEKTEYYVEFKTNKPMFNIKKIKIDEKTYENMNNQKTFYYKFDLIRGNSFQKINKIQI